MKNRYREIRTQNQLTQTELAHNLGVTQQAVAKWENGHALPEPSMLAKLAAFFGVSADYLLGITDACDGLPPAARSVQIPVLGAVRAGFGMAPVEIHQGSESAQVRQSGDYFYLLVQGDSMEPYIHHGDLALVHRQPTLEDGDLGVVLYGDGEATLKRFRRKGACIQLEPFNPTYETLTLCGDEIALLYIFGKVVETKTRW